MNTQHKSEHATGALETVKNLVLEGVISKEQVIHFVNTIDENSTPVKSVDLKNTLLTKILYIIGGIITLSGVLVLLANNWDNIGFAGQWLITIGLGLSFYINACLIAKKKDFNALSQVLFSVSSILLFWGGYVWYDYLFAVDGLGLGSSFTNETLSISFLLLLTFVSALYVYRKPVLHVISTIFFSLTYYALVANFIQSYSLDYVSMFYLRDLTIYSVMILGIGYIAYGFWLKNIHRLYKIYSFFGFGSFLLAGLFLDGIWDLCYAFLAITSIAVSIHLKNSIGLMLTSVAIGAYCIKISVTYFAGSLGFPFILLFSGLLIIALGYLTYYLNKKYITQY